MADGHEWMALHAALAGPPVEEHLQAVLLATADLTGTRLIAVWAEETVWGLAGFLGLREATEHGWATPAADLLAHLYGAPPAPAPTPDTPGTPDLLDPATAVCVDGTNFAVVSEIALAA